MALSHQDTDILEVRIIKTDLFAYFKTEFGIPVPWTIESMTEDSLDSSKFLLRIKKS